MQLVLEYMNTSRIEPLRERDSEIDFKSKDVKYQFLVFGSGWRVEIRVTANLAPCIS